MAYFIVVHHKLDSTQTWSNDWDGLDKLKSISTTPEIARNCARAKDRGERVYVHRCGMDGADPTICCSVTVSDARIIDDLAIVEFEDARSMNATPTVRPGRGQNHYEAEPPVE